VSVDSFLLLLFMPCWFSLTTLSHII
jgi:hypothetical protein